MCHNSLLRRLANQGDFREMGTIDGLSRTKYLRGRGDKNYNSEARLRRGPRRGPDHPLPTSYWGIVQWQDSGLWRRRWRFDPSSPSQPPAVKLGTPGKAPGVFHFFNLRTIRRAIRRNHPGVRPPDPAAGRLMMKNRSIPHEETEFLQSGHL